MGLREFGLLISFVLCTTAPGLYLLRKSSFSASERFVFAVAISLPLLGLSTALIYVLELSWRWSFFPTVLCGVAGVALVKRALSQKIPDSALCYTLATAFVTFLALQVRCFSGAYWYGDWYEHYHRSLYFLEHLPRETVFLGKYLFPARPPFFNLITAFFMAQWGSEFAVFQLICILLNTLVVASTFLFFQRWSPAGTPKVSFILGVLCLPFFVQNSLFTWTKGLSAFYVMAGLYLYLRNAEGESLKKWAFLACGVAMVIHYSAAPYIVFLGLHSLLTTHHRMRAFFAASLSVAPLLVWLVAASLEFGWRSTLFSNSSAEGIRQLHAAQLLKQVAYNIAATLFPYPLRSVHSFLPPYETVEQYVRDLAFLLYQTNLLFALGSSGFVAVIVALLRRRSHAISRGETRTVQFWELFLATSIVIGVGTVGTIEPFGVTHVVLQPLVYLGVALGLAEVASWSRFSRRFYAIALGTDLALGIVLHVWVQHVRTTGANCTLADTVGIQLLGGD